MTERDLTGKWAVCGGGRIGRIERQGHRGTNPCWFGTGISGRPWQTACPHVLAPSNQVVLDGIIKLEVKSER
jgi:hypothetical protein